MRLLLSKPDALGDQFIAAGSAQALRRLQPDWRIVWHVRAGMEVFAPLIGGHVFTPDPARAPEAEAARLARETAPLIVLPYPLSAFEPWSDSLRERVRWWSAFLRASSWDATVLGLVNRNWVGDFTVAVATAPIRVGFAANAARQPLVNEAQALAGADAPTFTTSLPPSFTRPEAAQMRDLLAVLEPRLAAVEPVPVWQPAKVGLPSVNAAARPRILIAPGVGGDLRRAWGVKNFIRVADVLRAQGAVVTWLEGPGDAGQMADLPAEEAKAHIRFGTGDLPLLLEALIGHDLLLCHDTAYAHIAAGIGIPTVAIYGAGQHQRFHPAGGRVKIVQSQIACAGCQWHCLWDRLVCVTDIPVEIVATAAREMLLGQATTTEVAIATPLAGALEGEPSAVRRRLQEEVLSLNADRFARLQIIQSLLASPPAAANQSPPPSGTPPPPEVPGAPSEPKLSVIIPMGRPERVASTLASLAAQACLPAHWEIILVGVEAAPVARAYPNLPIVPVVLEKNLLPTRTRCLGVERATGDWFLFIDDDVELAPDCHARFLELLATPAFAPSAPKAVGTIGFRLPGKSGRFCERLTDISNFWAQQDGRAEDRDWLYSAAIFVRADAYRQSGGFNPDLPNAEDVDLTRRIAGAGFRIRYEPVLVARHDHRRDTFATMWRYFWRNGNAARYFFGAHGGACPFSVKTVWLKTWSDFAMNRSFQRERGVPLGLRAPFIWLNYLIVESSLEWHWQAYIHEEARYRQLPARAPSDVTLTRALTAWDGGKRVRGSLGYALAVLQDFANPVRR